MRVTAKATDSGRVLTRNFLPGVKQVAAAMPHTPLSPTTGPLLQRKSNCACGGGCPRCQKARAHPSANHPMLPKSKR
jgi:hypothetical protein